MRGRKPIPTEIKRKKGTLKRCRTNPAEPKPGPANSEPPEFMAMASKSLMSRGQVYRNSIFIPRTASTYQVLSADAYTKHGLNAHGIIFDELHAQPNRELWDVLATSTGARSQPLTVAITTAGFDRNSICWELHEYARRIKEGVIEDDSFLPVIYAADEQDDWRDPKIWRKANPNLGVSISEDYLKRECAKAGNVPAYENTFRRLHLNQWTQQESRWLPMAACRTRPGCASRRPCP